MDESNSVSCCFCSAEQGQQQQHKAQTPTTPKSEQGTLSVEQEFKHLQLTETESTSCDSHDESNLANEPSTTAESASKPLVEGAALASSLTTSDISTAILKYAATGKSFEIELMLTRPKAEVFEWAALDFALNGALSAEAVTRLTLYHPRFIHFQRDTFQLAFFGPLHYTRDDPFPGTALAVNHLERPQAEALVSRLPNVLNLVIFDCLPRREVLRLLNSAWSKQLTSFVFSTTNASFDWAKFWLEVRQMTALRHLALIRVRGPINHTILRQLHSFSAEYAYTEYDYADDPPSSMAALFTCFGPEIRAIGFHTFAEPPNCRELPQTLAAFARTNPAMAEVLRTKVTQLTLQSHRLLRRHYFALGQFFTALTHLDLELGEEARFTAILADLADLQQLSHLRLSCKSIKSRFYLLTEPAEDSADYETPMSRLCRAFGYPNPEEENTYANVPARVATPMPTIRILHLSIAASPVLSSTTLPHWYTTRLAPYLPSLEALHFENAGRLYQCICRSVPKSAQSLSAYLCGSYDCDRELHRSFTEDFSNLQTVTRNGATVYDRPVHRANRKRFYYQLKQNGQSEYSAGFNLIRDEDIQFED